MRGRGHRITWPWILFTLWFTTLLIGAARPSVGVQYIDFNSYQTAAQALVRGESMYTTPIQSQQIWRVFHNDQQALQEARAAGRGAEVVQAQLARPQHPGPYIYLPTLASLIAHFRITPPVFTVLLLIAVWGFSWLWIRSQQRSSWWLLFIIGSWDVLASLMFGNVELLLLGATLLAATSMWQRRTLIAAPLVAFVVLVKPFYALFFIVFGLLQLVSNTASRRQALRSSTTIALGALVIIGFEVWRWGPALRSEAIQYLRHSLEHLWFTLPIAEQTPMSAWNRTPMQVLLTAGLAPTIAQIAALMLWAVLVIFTIWYARSRSVTFSHAFALSFVLLYLGRPVAWGLPYLSVVVVAAVWPLVHGWKRYTLLGVAIALLLSHWVAFMLTATGVNMALMTLQTATVPWETFLVLPLSWLVVLRTLPPTASLPTTRFITRSEVRHGNMVESSG